MRRAATFLIMLALLVPLMSAQPAAADGTAGAAFNGFDYDRVGSGATLTSDGSPDGTFTLKLDRGGSHRVTSLRLNAGSTGGVWSTTPDAYWVLGVTAPRNGAPLLNRPDKTIDVPMTDAVILRLHAADFGYITGVATFTLTACFDDSATDCASATVNAADLLPPFDCGFAEAAGSALCNDVSSLPPPPPTTAPDALGNRWEECETHAQTYCYTFVRQGTGTTWTADLGNGATATLTITLDGSTVTIQRRDSAATNPLVATYTGTLNGDQVSGSVTWWYEDTPELNSTGVWNATIFGAATADVLGTRWEECETHAQTYCYTFVRQGASSTWTAALHNGETATLTITLDGNTVTIQRRDSAPTNPLVAEYTGTLNGDQVSGSVTWWYEDTPELNSTGVWNATIFGASAGAPPPPTSTDPLAPGHNTGRYDFFARGQDNGLWHVWFHPDGGEPAWESLGGSLTSGPDAASWGVGRLDVFARGTDNGLWHRAYDQSTWYGWESLGGEVTSDPSVVSWGPNRLDVFVRGPGNALWHKWWDGSSWSGWESLGGSLISAPDAASSGPNSLDVFALGTDNAMWHLAWNGTSWGNWESLGGQFNSDPGATSVEANSVNVFVRGMDNQIWWTFNDGSGWAGWSYIDDEVGSGPDACSSQPGFWDIFVRGLNNELWGVLFDDDGSSSWGTLGGSLTSDPSVVC